jgi:ankyrin repeat protein
MDQSHENEAGGGELDLHTLLSQDPIQSWLPIHKRIQNHPNEATERYYRNESCLQLALRATERVQPESSSGSSLENNDQESAEKSIHRIDVLKGIVDVDPDAILCRDDEGRTPLHTACAAGRSFQVLQWLLRQERKATPNNVEGESNNAMLRTDFPGGALPLHAVAACSTFDDAFQTNENMSHDENGIVNEEAMFMYSKCTSEIRRCAVSVRMTPNILSAFASTATIIGANPNAIWDKDCEGELPIHSAASFGNVGSVLALLNAAQDCDMSSSKAALTLNDRQKTPLHCACERVVAFSIHSKRDETESTAASARRSELSSFRVSIERDDPFEGWDSSPTASSRARSRRLLRGNLNASLNMDSSSNLRGSVTHDDRRGYATSARSSLSASFVLSGGRFGHENEQHRNDNLRFSFTSTRRPVHPEFGLESLDDDGMEEFSKVELLTMAASGCFHGNGSKRGQSNKQTDAFCLVHELIKLNQPPEVIWHAARKYPFEVTMKDGTGRLPLHLACERLVQAVAVDDEDQSNHTPNDEIISDGADAYSTSSFAGSEFIESFLLGSSNTLPDVQIPIKGADSKAQSDGQYNNKAQTRALSSAPEHKVSSAIEIIHMLLRSKEFGSKEMAAVSDNKGRLPLHVVLEAVQWTENDDEESPHPMKALIDADPYALECRDDSTGLYPFMIAATASANYLVPSEDNDLATVETIYRLLLASPASLSLCLSSQCS